MIAEILPPAVAAAEAFGDLPDVELYPGEEAVIAHAVDNRRREFATGRACARTALAKPARAAIRERNADASNAVISLVAVRQEVIASQNALVFTPPGATTPSPVMTTLLSCISCAPCSLDRWL